jgi:hypothetical protein
MGVRELILAAFVMMATPAFAVELFRYRGAANTSLKPVDRILPMP